MIFVFAAIFSILFVIIEVLQKFVFTKYKWSRKATHISMGFVLFYMPVYLNRNEIIILSLLFVFALALSKFKNILTLHNVARKTICEIFYCR